VSGQQVEGIGKRRNALAVVAVTAVVSHKIFGGTFGYSTRARFLETIRKINYLSLNKSCGGSVPLVPSLLLIVFYLGLPDL
jgi:hypothetical protein